MRWKLRHASKSRCADICLGMIEDEGGYACTEEAGLDNSSIDDDGVRLHISQVCGCPGGSRPILTADSRSFGKSPERADGSPGLALTLRGVLRFSYRGEG